MRTILTAAILVATVVGAYAQGCQTGQVWCCRKNFSGSVECSCSWGC